MNRITILGLVFIFWALQGFAQDPLPDFSVHKVSGRVVVSWYHDYPVVKQVSIQRSHDSLNYFKTIATMPDPGIKENGFADRQPLTDSMFYRIYVLLDQGKYIVTKSKRPVLDSSGTVNVPDKVPPANTNTQGFLPPGFSPSPHVFTSADRYVRVELPTDAHKYSIKFYSETFQPLFELTDIKERKFKLDKSYFYKAGYIHFELFADGKLIEKHKLFIPKDF